MYKVLYIPGGAGFQPSTVVIHFEILRWKPNMMVCKRQFLSNMATSWVSKLNFRVVAIMIVILSYSLDEWCGKKTKEQLLKVRSNEHFTTKAQTFIGRNNPPWNEASELEHLKMDGWKTFAFPFGKPYLNRWLLLLASREGVFLHPKIWSQNLPPAFRIEVPMFQKPYPLENRRLEVRWLKLCSWGPWYSV